MTKRYIERFQWPLGLAIILLIVEMLLGEGHRTSPTNRNAAMTVLGLLWLPMACLASPAEARRAMEQNDFSKALQLYEEQIEANLTSGSQDARLYYNAGAAAYRAGDFDKARNHFNSTLASPETPLPLQQQAFYNLGNTMFRLGETTDNPDDKAKQWIDSLKKYEGALKLSQQLEDTPEDEDARFNTEIVKKRLEQLKQQQQNQQQQSDNNKEQEKQDQQNQNSEQEKQDQQNQNSEQEKQGEQQKQSDSTGDDKKKQPQPNQGQEQRDAGQVKPNGKMTPEQVRQLLDTLKQQERSLIYRPVQKGKANKRGIIKNW